MIECWLRVWYDFPITYNGVVIVAEDYVYEMFKEAIEEVIQEKIEKSASEKEIEKLTSQKHNLLPQ